MITSFFVYGFMAFSLFFLGKIASNRQNTLEYKRMSLERMPFFTGENIFIFVIFSFFSGVRWQVGVDHLSYMEQYNYFAQNGFFNRESFEIGYEFIVSTLVEFGFSAVFFFVLFAFLQLYPIYYRFKNERYLYPFIGFLIICGPTYLSWMNGMRQCLAALIFVFATQFIIKRSIIKYLLCLGLAMCFHKSAIIMLPFYFIPNRAIFRNRTINICLIIGSLIIGSIPVWHQNITRVAPLLAAAGYDGYADNLADILKNEGRDMAFGPRRIITFVLQMLIVYFAPRLVKLFASKGYNLYFTFFMLGVVLFNLLANTSHIFLRPILYFDFFSVILLSYLMYYLSSINKQSLNTLLYCLIILLSIGYLVIVCYAESIAEIDFSNYKFIFGNNNK